jgi:hypothetical protein
MRVWLPLLPPLPTATQELVAEQATLVNVSALPALGLATIDHAEPFQVSTSVSTGELSVLKDPTAVQAVAEMHDTPLSTLKLVFTFGMGTIAHAVPFHDSISVVATVVLGAR